MGIANILFHYSPIFQNRLFFNEPKRGDVIVFKTPADNRTDYIKRLIGLPGDELQFINGDLFLNNNQIFKSLISSDQKVYCGNEQIDVNTYRGKTSKWYKYITVYRKNYTFQIQINM